ncbi:hypothetical protein ACEPPN_017037 [Leptodophora sp. 'Broadleaf-Isolate-01']
MKILLTPHNPSWALQFNAAKSSLHQTLHGIPIVSIEHVGSTSIPGLLAKPVIDIDIVVPASFMAATRAALVAAGYTDMGDQGVPERIAFRGPGYGIEEVVGSPPGPSPSEVSRLREFRENTDVKNILLQDAELRNEYAECKMRLVDEIEDGGEGLGIDDYVRGKTGVLAKILRKAGWTEEMLEEVRKVNE